MKVVAENSGKDLALRSAEAEVARAMRKHAANVLRIVAGAGKPERIISEAVEVETALRAYREATGAWPRSDMLNRFVDPYEAHVEHRPWIDREEYLSSDERRAESDIVRGAIRMAAAMLLDQMTQASTADGQMWEGIRRMERVNAEQVEADLVRDGT